MAKPSFLVQRLFGQVIAAVAWFALALQLYILINNTPGNGLTPLSAVGRFLVFFTILSNLLVAVATSCTSLLPQTAAGRYFSRPPVATALALYILVVGLVYNIILRPLWAPAGAQKLADELLHVAVPVLYLLYWLLYAPRQVLPWKYAFTWLLYPAAYLFYALLRGHFEGFYPYPFIDVAKQGWSKVLLNSFGMLVVFVVTGCVLIGISRRIAKAGTS